MSSLHKTIQEYNWKLRIQKDNLFQSYLFKYYSISNLRQVYDGKELSYSLKPDNEGYLIAVFNQFIGKQKDYVLLFPTYDVDLSNDRIEFSDLKYLYLRKEHCNYYEIETPCIAKIDKDDSLVVLGKGRLRRRHD